MAYLFKDDKSKAVIRTFTAAEVVKANSIETFYESHPSMEDVPFADITLLGFQWRITNNRWNPAGIYSGGIPFVEIRKNPDGSGKNRFYVWLQNRDSSDQSIMFRITYMISDGN